MLSSPPQGEGALDHAGRRLVAFAAAFAAAIAAPFAAALAALAEAVVAELGRHVAHRRLGVARELRLLVLAQLDGRQRVAGEQRGRVQLMLT